MDKRLDEKRERIDEINNSIIALLDERFQLSKEIGNIKKEINMKVLDTSREKIIIENIKDSLRDSENTNEILNVFQSILKESRNIQQ